MNREIDGSTVAKHVVGNMASAPSAGKVDKAQCKGREPRTEETQETEHTAEDGRHIERTDKTVDQIGTTR